MLGAFMNGRLAAVGTAGTRTIALGLAMATSCAALLLCAVAGGLRPLLPLAASMIGVALAFGLISPNAVDGATRPHSAIAGSAAAMTIFLQMVGAATGSDLVARFFDGRSALSTASVMLGASLFAVASYAALARPAERRAATTSSTPTASQTEEASA